MNFLAHFYLAEPNGEHISGGLLGDFVKGPLTGKYPAGIEDGIRLHRHIDRITDAHPNQKLIRKSLPKKYSRYSNIIADVLCDHTLSNHWSDLHDQNIASFSAFCYTELTRYEHLFPERAQRILERMGTGNWLCRYHETDFIFSVLSRIGSRIRFENPLHLCQDVLPPLIAEFDPLCLEILHDTKLTVQKWHAEHHRGTTK